MSFLLTTRGGDVTDIAEWLSDTLILVLGGCVTLSFSSRLRLPLVGGLSPKVLRVPLIPAVVFPSDMMTLYPDGFNSGSKRGNSSVLFENFCHFPSSQLCPPAHVLMPQGGLAGTWALSATSRSPEQ